MVFSQQPTNATAGAADQPRRDGRGGGRRIGNVVTSDSSTVTLTLSSGTFASGSSTATATASSGVATFSSLKIDTAGTYTLTATDGTLTGRGLEQLHDQPGGGQQAGLRPAAEQRHGRAAISPAVTVEVEDAYGNVVTSDSSTVTLTLSSGTFASGSSTATATASSGVATFSGLTIDTAGTLHADGDGRRADQLRPRSSFTISPAAASKLVFSQQPSNATAGAAISPAVTVKVEDAYGNVVTSDSSTVTVTLSSGTFASGSSTATATASSGVATFSGLTIDTAGTYTLTATDGTLTGATSGSFTISPAAASSWSSASSRATPRPAQRSAPVTVKVEDTYGNVVTSDSSTVTVALSSGTFAVGRARRRRRRRAAWRRSAA